jgi:hypothetical protein
LKHFLKSIAITATLLASFIVYASDSQKNPMERAKEISVQISTAQASGDYDTIRRLVSEINQNPALRACFTPQQLKMLGL